MHLSYEAMLRPGKVEKSAKEKQVSDSARISGSRLVRGGGMIRASQLLPQIGIAAVHSEERMRRITATPKQQSPQPLPPLAKRHCRELEIFAAHTAITARHAQLSSSENMYSMVITAHVK